MSLASSLESLRKIDINDLDLNNIGSWPAAVKVIVCVLLTAAVLALGYNFHLSDMQAQLEQQAAEEETLKQQFSTKAFQAANLEAYKAQMKEMEESFGALLRQLPSDTEVPGLLEDITRTGLGSAGVRGDQAAPRGHPAVLHRAADPDQRGRWLSRPGDLCQRRLQSAADRHPA